MPVPSSTAVVFVSGSVLADFLSGKTLPILASALLPTKGIFKSVLMNLVSSGALGLGAAVPFLGQALCVQTFWFLPMWGSGSRVGSQYGLALRPISGMGGPLSKCLTHGSFGRGTSLLAGPVACGQAPVLRKKAGSWGGGLFPLRVGQPLHRTEMEVQSNAPLPPGAGAVGQHGHGCP